MNVKIKPTKFRVIVQQKWSKWLPVSTSSFRLNPLQLTLSPSQEILPVAPFMRLRILNFHFNILSLRVPVAKQYWFTILTFKFLPINSSNYSFRDLLRSSKSQLRVWTRDFMQHFFLVIYFFCNQHLILNGNFRTKNLFLNWASLLTVPAHKVSIQC